jgi:hypothetical protein
MFEVYIHLLLHKEKYTQNKNIFFFLFLFFLFFYRFRELSYILDNWLNDFFVTYIEKIYLKELIIRRSYNIFNIQSLVES